MTQASYSVWGDDVPAPIAAGITLVGLLFAFAAADRFEAPPVEADAAQVDAAPAELAAGEPAPVPDEAPSIEPAPAAEAETAPSTEPEPDEVAVAEAAVESAAAAEPVAAPEPVAPAEAPPQACAPTLTVMFGEGARMDDPAAADVQRVVDWAASHPDAPVVVRGHADSVGDEGYNLFLSRQRAQRVAALLYDAGLADGRATVQAFGEFYPAAGEPEDAMVNRRVVVELLGAPPCEEIR